jgi:hypothetical protein
MFRSIASLRNRALGVRAGIVIGFAIALVGLLAGTATGVATPFQQVVVVNPASSPVNVSVTNPTQVQTVTGSVNVTSDPYQQALQFRSDFDATIVGNCATNQEKITVPSGQVLVIENVFVEGSATPNHRVIGVLQVKFGGLTAHYRFSAPFSAVDPPSVRFPDGEDVWDGTFPTKIVAQAGDSVLINGCTGGTEVSGHATIEVVVTGHFIAAN